ncbi:MAG: hypothetical protein ACPGYX_11905, partial [Oceanobacter sp.]
EKVINGPIGTNIFRNSGWVHGRSTPLDYTAKEVANEKKKMMQRGVDVEHMTDDEFRKFNHDMMESNKDNAPVSAREAAELVFAGIENED